MRRGEGDGNERGDGREEKRSKGVKGRYNTKRYLKLSRVGKVDDIEGISALR